MDADSSSGRFPANPRKRRRPALSCEQCRRRKVRCDREMPCGPCTKSHPPLECEYVNEGKAALDNRFDLISKDQESSTHSFASQVGSTSTDRARIAQLEQTIQALQGRVQKLEAPGQNEVRGCTLPANAFDDRLPRLSQGPPKASGQSNSPQTLIPALHPRLNSTGDSLKVFGTTHWALVFQQVSSRPLSRYHGLTASSCVFCGRCAAQLTILMAIRTRSVKLLKRFGESERKLRVIKLRGWKNRCRAY